MTIHTTTAVKGAVLFLLFACAAAMLGSGPAVSHIDGAPVGQEKASFLQEIRELVVHQPDVQHSPAHASRLLKVKMGRMHPAIEGDDKCFVPKINHYSPAKNQHLETCCWYDSLTCCSRSVVGDYVPRLMAFLTRLHEELEVSDACYLAVADFVCMHCAPDTATFIRPGKNMTYQLHFCLSFCDKLYDACKADLTKLPGADATATNGKELCTALFHQEGDVQPFVFDDSNERCFSGVPLTEIQSSHCLPGDTDEHGTSNSTSSSSGWSAQLTGLEVAFIVVVPILLVIIAVLVGVLVGTYLRNRRRQRSTSTSIYDESDFNIQLSAFDEDGQ